MGNGIGYQASGQKIGRCRTTGDCIMHRWISTQGRESSLSLKPRADIPRSLKRTYILFFKEYQSGEFSQVQDICMEYNIVKSRKKWVNHRRNKIEATNTVSLWIVCCKSITMLKFKVIMQSEIILRWCSLAVNDRGNILGTHISAYQIWWRTKSKLSRQGWTAFSQRSFSFNPIQGRWNGIGPVR